MALEFRTITKDEVPQFREALINAFGADGEVDAGGDERFVQLIELSQAWSAFDAGKIVATAATFNLEISVPGGAALPMAGLTMVSVRPSHRRRGILRELMKLHFDDAGARKFPVSGLWASDARIYGRFDYGLAAYCDSYEIANADKLVIAGDKPLDELEWIDETRAREVLPAVYARATDARPGALRRTPTWWKERRFLETPWARGGGSKRRHVLAKRGNDIVGYLAYRQKGKFTDGIGDGKTEISELVAIDPRAEATLWRLACSIDLFPSVGYWNAPADDSLPWIADDWRRIKRRRGDALWLAPIDIPAMLASRTYATDGVLRISILGDATYELAVEAGRGRATVTTKPADITCSKQTFGSLYLGGISASELARADLVHGEPRTVQTADRLLASSIAPWCPEVF